VPSALAPVGLRHTEFAYYVAACRVNRRGNN
jgi:hypothetical protein